MADSVFPGFREMKQRRRAAGLSQTEVAARMGTSQSAVARIEAGTSDVRLSTLLRYAEAIGHELDLRLEKTDD
jgi:predicted transcriptional regulator